jgi:general secretion pathway protein F
MATLLEAGVPVKRAFATLEGTARPARLRAAVGRIGAQLEAGNHLAEAFELEKGLFPPLVRRMVDVGERTGTLGAMAQDLAEYYEWRSRLLRRTITALIWPGIMFVGALLVLGFLVYVFESLLGMELTWAKRLLKIVIGGTAGLIILGFLGRCFLVGRKVTDFILIEFPGLGKLVRKFVVARFTWALHLMTRAAVSLPEAISRSAEATNNRAFCDRVLPAAEEVAQGTTLTESLAATGFFDPQFLNIIEVGEGSGNLDETLSRLSLSYSEDAQFAGELLAKILGWVIYAAVALFLIYLIFIVFTRVYLGAFQGLL